MKQIKQPEDFEKLDKAQLHQLWFNEALTDGQVAKMYGIEKNVVKQKRKEMKLNWFSAATLFLMGGSRYKNNKTKVAR